MGQKPNLAHIWAQQPLYFPLSFVTHIKHKGLSFLSLVNDVQNDIENTLGFLNHVNLLVESFSSSLVMSEHIFCGCVQNINCKTFLTHYKSLSFSKDEEIFLFFGFAREKSERAKHKMEKKSSIRVW